MKISKPLRNVILFELFFPITLLTLGIYHGLMQTIYRSGLVHSAAEAHLDYYQGLTLHGVINAIVLTTFFAVAFGHAIMAYYLKKEPDIRFARISLIFMVVGTLMAAYAMLSGKASVLYTFYPPLRADPTFYLGAVFLIVGSWIAFWGWIILYRTWRKEHKTDKIPMAVLGNIANFTVWQICTLSVAVEVLVFILPWSMGWTNTINVALCRTLFWFFGHALVYFWLLPSYIMFYTFLPKLAGGKLYSGNAGRFSFMLFIILSIPVGVHHQFGEPGITSGTKLFQTILTFGITLPSFITAFTMAATLEYAGRKRGSKGLFGWMAKLPYLDTKNYMFGYLICGLILFIFGGLTGMVNASYSLNSMVHNTSWVPGHFHMTVAGPVYLAIIGMTLYLTSKLSGKPVRFPNLNIMVPYLWCIGILIFSYGLMSGGLLGEPRRTNLGLTYLNPASSQYRPDWIPSTAFALIGGIIMTLSALCYFITFFGTVFSKRKEEPILEFPDSELLHNEPTMGILNRFAPWVIMMIIVLLLAYIPAIMNISQYIGPGAQPFSPNNPVPMTF